MNTFAKLAVLRNLALGLKIDAHLKTGAELRVLPATLAALRAEGFLDHLSSLTDTGQRRSFYAVRRLARLPLPDKR